MRCALPLLLAPLLMAAASPTTPPAREAPQVTIGGKAVVTRSDLERGTVPLAVLPERLQHEGAQEALQARSRLQFFQHNPQLGAADAPLTYAEFTDLSCLQCMPLLKTVDAALVSHTNVLRKVHVSLPVDKFGGTNLAAFYGKVAQEAGVFWEYRKRLIDTAEPDADSYMRALISSGIQPQAVRRLVLNHSRRFYRELDADIQLAQRLRQEKPPALFLNGVPLGGSWIPLEDAGALATYEQQRLAY